MDCQSLLQRGRCTGRRQAGKWINDWSYEKTWKSLKCMLWVEANVKRLHQHHSNCVTYWKKINPKETIQRSVRDTAKWGGRWSQQHRPWRGVNYFVQFKILVTEHLPKPKDAKHQHWVPCKPRSNTLRIPSSLPGGHHGGCWLEGAGLWQQQVWASAVFILCFVMNITALKMFYEKVVKHL